MLIRLAHIHVVLSDDLPDTEEFIQSVCVYCRKSFQELLMYKFKKYNIKFYTNVDDSGNLKIYETK